MSPDQEQPVIPEEKLGFFGQPQISPEELSAKRFREALRSEQAADALIIQARDFQDIR